MPPGHRTRRRPGSRGPGAGSSRRPGRPRLTREVPRTVPALRGGLTDRGQTTSRGAAAIRPGPATQPRCTDRNLPTPPGSSEPQVSGRPPRQSDPEETAVFPRLRMIDPQAEEGEPSVPEQPSVTGGAERSGDYELPTAIQAPLARTADPQEPGSEPPTAAREPVAEGGTAKSPPGDRPADITRPQLILDDTMVDMAGLRGGWNPRQNGTAGAGEAPLADGAAPPTATPNPPTPAARRPARPRREAARFSDRNPLRGPTC